MDINHIDWNHIASVVFTFLAAWFGGRHGASNGNGSK